MVSGKLKLFIVDDDRPMAITLKNFLYSKFGKGLDIFLFNNGEKCLQNLDNNTDIVIMDADAKSMSGQDVVRSIKAISPKTEVIVFSNNQDVAIAIESYKKGAADVVTKDTRGINKITYFINKVITEPIRRLVDEYGVSKFMVIFFSTFITMGIVVYLFIKYVPVYLHH
ncbi:MAG: hypothetical protein JWP12_3563 [Bacteroidetes bacterium]|nr:hypothetical protein [Bacteroidota bacterium]